MPDQAQQRSDRKIGEIRNPTRQRSRHSISKSEAMGHSLLRIVRAGLRVLIRAFLIRSCLETIPAAKVQTKRGTTVRPAYRVARHQILR